MDLVLSWLSGLLLLWLCVHDGMEFGDGLCFYDGFGCVLFSGDSLVLGCVLSRFCGFKSPRCLILCCSIVVSLYVAPWFYLGGVGTNDFVRWFLGNNVVLQRIPVTIVCALHCLREVATLVGMPVTSS